MKALDSGKIQNVKNNKKDNTRAIIDLRHQQVSTLLDQIRARDKCDENILFKIYAINQGFEIFCSEYSDFQNQFQSACKGKRVYSKL